MRFTKMHGQGNDFVMIGARDAEGADLPALARRLCDRNRGIGGDGLIINMPSDKCDFTMRIFNADGSEPEMCGNGVRCAAKYYLDKTPPADIASRVKDGRVAISVDTLAGVRNILAEYSGGVTGGMSVDMGAPILTPADIPVNAASGSATGISFEACGRTFTATCVSMGNPHCVIFVATDPFSLDIRDIGPAIETHSIFPRKTNVEFAQVLGPAEIRMRVWERGCGETLACGTGACATLVAASLNSLTGRSAVIHLGGGDLHIEWTESGNVIMTGPATIVFEGEIDG